MSDIPPNPAWMERWIYSSFARDTEFSEGVISTNGRNSMCSPSKKVYFVCLFFLFNLDNLAPRSPFLQVLEALIYAGLPDIRREVLRICPNRAVEGSEFAEKETKLLFEENKKKHSILICEIRLVCTEFYWSLLWMKCKSSIFVSGKSESNGDDL